MAGMPLAAAEGDGVYAGTVKTWGSTAIQVGSLPLMIRLLIRDLNEHPHLWQDRTLQQVLDVLRQHCVSWI